MKNIILAVLCSGALMGTAAVSFAQPVNQSALAPTQITTAKTAATLKDDTKVKLKGQITRSLGDEKYEFRDSTGTITVDIDDELWNGRALDAKASVTLIGEIDVDLLPTKRVEVEVDEVIF